MRLTSLTDSLWIAALICTLHWPQECVVAFQQSVATTRITTTTSTSTCRQRSSDQHVRCTGTILQAYGLPDEFPEEDVNDDDTDVSENTLQSLAKKLDKSKQADAAAPLKKKDNDAMAFLRNMGRVGGAANKNFVNAVGSDEGSTGRQPPAVRDSGSGSSGGAATGGGGGVGSSMKKARSAYQVCTDSGTIDDMTAAFPFTSSGTEWRGVSDRVMGGVSDGFITREIDLEGRAANILKGRVSLANNGGFIQMVTDLPLDLSKDYVDASDYDGIELDVLYRQPRTGTIGEDNNNEDEEMSAPSTEPQTFNVHVRTPGTFRQASYRHTFEISEPNKWKTIFIPFTSFLGYGVAVPLDISTLRRVGIVAIGREMDVFLGVGGVRFYSVM
jgi:hypothetical protein